MRGLSCGNKANVQGALDDVKKQNEKAESAFSDNSAVNTIKEIGAKLVGTIEKAVEEFTDATNCTPVALDCTATVSKIGVLTGTEVSTCLSTLKLLS